MTSEVTINTNPEFSAKTPLGEKLLTLREEAIAEGMQLLTPGEILLSQQEQEIERLKERLNKLGDAASAVIDRWNSPNWKDSTHTGELIARLEAALTGQKGGEDA
jgi:hypothetical protein